MIPSYRECGTEANGTSVPIVVYVNTRYTVSMKTEYRCANPDCTNTVWRTPATALARVFCSRECCNIVKRGGRPNVTIKPRPRSIKQAGDRRMHNGYWVVYLPDHPNADKDGTIGEHRLVMSEHLGRPLLPDEHVHHKNHDRSDNRISNLEIVSPSEHMKLHSVAWQTDWSKHGGGCADCKTTDRKHYAHGLCQNCYSKMRMTEGRDRGYVAPSRLAKLARRDIPPRTRKRWSTLLPKSDNN